MNAVPELCTPIQEERELQYITKKRERFLPPKRLLVYSVPFPADLNAVIAVSILFNQMQMVYFFLVERDLVPGREECRAGIFKESMGARNRGGRGLSYRPARLHRLAEFIPWNRFLGPIHV